MTSKSATAFRQIESWTRIGVGVLWIWHGFVPKLIVSHPLETSPLISAGFDESTAGVIVVAAGIAEIVFGLFIIVARKYDWGLWLTILAMFGLLTGVIVTVPSALEHPFNPVTTNLSCAILAGVCLVSRMALRESDGGAGRLS